MEFKLLTNGMIDNYPRFIISKTFKVKHWKNLSSTSDEMQDEVLTECLNDVIDFSQTKFITSSDELTLDDRTYLLVQQFFYCRKNTISLNYICNNETCGNKKTSNTIAIDKEIVESLMKGKIKKEDKFILKDVNEELTVKLPVYKDVKEYKEKLKAYGEVHKDDLDYEVFSYLQYYPFIKFEGGFETLDDFLNWIYEIDGRFIKLLDEYVQKTYHSLNIKKKMRCSECKKEEEVEQPVEMSFFL